MKGIKSKHIKMALQSELIGVEPSRNIWSGIASSLPPMQNTQHTKRRIPLTAILAMVFILSTGGIALADTDYGKKAVNWIFQKFGIHLVTNTPQLTEELKQQGAVTILQGMLLKDNMDRIPEGMKLPSYMPESAAASEPKLYELEGGAGIRWSAGDQQYVEVWFHNHAFGEGSRTITDGEPRDIQEVWIGNLTGMAFRDDDGWEVSWQMDGHQYQVRTNISLEEAVLVADSIK